jgi:type II secretory pathway predicted ATPase ExeA
MKNDEFDLNDYVHRWGARHVPFQDQPQQRLFHTDSTRKAVELLQQAASLRSVMLLSGENGSGKSVLVAEWIKTLSPKAYLPVVITQATLSPSGLLSTLTAKLGGHPRLLRSTNLIAIEEALGRLGRIIPVLILDEAQNYTPSAIEEVRLLLGLNLPPQPAFALILIGDNYLIDALRLQSRRPLYTRIALCFELPALNAEQIEAYLNHATEQAGLQRNCFEPEALTMLASACEGNPRTLNLLARAAWIEASRLASSTIAPPHVQYALRLVPVAHDKVRCLSP